MHLHKHTLGGFALLPDDALTAELIAFRNASPFSGPALGINTNLPHLTLFQGLYPANFRPDEALAHLAEVGGMLTTTITELTVEPGDWAMLTVHHSLLLTALHRIAADASAGVMQAPPAPEGTERWAPTEVEAFKRHGYRYAHDAYLPHITLGTAAEIDNATWDRFEKTLAGKPVEFGSVVFYRAGARGTLRTIVAGKELRHPSFV